MKRLTKNWEAIIQRQGQQTNKQTNKGKDKKHGYTFLFPRRMKKISDGLIHYRRSSESSSITSSSAGLVFLLSSTVTLSVFIKGLILILMAATHNCEVFYQYLPFPDQLLPVQQSYTSGRGSLTKSTNRRHTFLISTVGYNASFFDLVFCHILQTQLNK